MEEIAREAGVPAGTVKSWLSRGRARLAELLPGVAAEELEVNDVA
ncbi:sigma factor-like helix-turn-helix DNA-binding protein [Micromonospora sp. BRA006-A]|nr:sigma factor-like helix-turn-helix DNA-binding protein [Micromonospora sp. BRA006-A]